MMFIKFNIIFRTKVFGPSKGYFTDFSSSHPVAQVDQLLVLWEFY